MLTNHIYPQHIRYTLKFNFYTWRAKFWNNSYASYSSGFNYLVHILWSVDVCYWVIRTVQTEKDGGILVSLNTRELKLPV